MPTYNLTKPEDRERLRADRQSELDAIEAGKWPRDTNDVMRWSPPQRRDGTYTVEPVEWAARMCRADLQYLAAKELPRAELSPDTA
jgi:hypothetical protein